MPHLNSRFARAVDYACIIAAVNGCCDSGYHLWLLGGTPARFDCVLAVNAR